MSSGDVSYSDMATDLAEEFGIDIKKAQQLINNYNVKQKKSKKPKDLADIPYCPLPNDGTIDPERCHAVKANSGLNIQCKNKISKLALKNGKDYCTTCFHQSEKFVDGKPNFGDMRDIVALYDEGKTHLDYVNKKGKQTLPFALLVSKGKIKDREGNPVDLDKAIEFAESIGREIIEEDLNVVEIDEGKSKKKKTGRKPVKKNSDSKSTKAVKAKIVVVQKDGGGVDEADDEVDEVDDNDTESYTLNISDNEADDDGEEEDTDEIELSEIVIRKRKYWIDEEHFLYDHDTKTRIGKKFVKKRIVSVDK